MAVSFKDFLEKKTFSGFTYPSVTEAINASQTGKNLVVTVKDLGEWAWGIVITSGSWGGRWSERKQINSYKFSKFSEATRHFTYKEPRKITVWHITLACLGKKEVEHRLKKLSGAIE